MTTPVPVDDAPPPTPLRRDAAANRGRLIAAAVDVFNDEGLDAGVERIAQRAGVGVGTLYRRFPTKDALIGFLVEEMLAELTRAAVEAGGVPGGHGLEQFVRDVARQLCAHRGCLQRLWKHTPADRSSLDRLRGLIDGLVAEARDAGAVRADVTRADVSAVLWSLQGIIDNAGESAQTVCDRLLDVVFAGLRPS